MTMTHIENKELVSISYGGYASGKTTQYTPSNEQEVVALLQYAQSENRRLTLRGAGLSMDSHSVSRDISLSMEAFSDIQVDEVNATVTAGAGASWGAIMDKVVPMGLAPAVVISTRFATVGGTLSQNSLCKFSSIYGKEGCSVLSFRLLTLDGEARLCSREENRELFYSVIGGFGNLGVIVEVTHQLKRVGLPNHVESYCIAKEEKLEGLGKALIPESPDETRYGIISMNARKLRQLRFHSKHSNDKKLHRIWLYKPTGWLRVLVECIVHAMSKLANFVWMLAFYFHPFKNRRYIDEFMHFSFFTDANVKARALMKRFGRTFRMLEQTYVIPVQDGNVETFVQEMAQLCRKNNVYPMLFDVMYLPEDEDFLLSSTRGMSGVAINITFEGMNQKEALSIQELFSTMSQRCGEMGGRIHLVKNVYARPELLHQMYGEALQEFLEVKKKYDPNHILGSDFVERIFALDTKEPSN